MFGKIINYMNSWIFLPVSIIGFQPTAIVLCRTYVISIRLIVCIYLWVYTTPYDLYRTFYIMICVCKKWKKKKKCTDSRRVYRRFLKIIVSKMHVHVVYMFMLYMFEAVRVMSREFTLCCLVFERFFLGTYPSYTAILYVDFYQLSLKILEPINIQ